MPKLIIDGKEIEVPDGMTLLQACEEAGREIPRFCYHERLSIAGNCRMCLVEVVGMPKLAASCALSVNDLRPGPNGEPPQIKTNSPEVKKAREGTMEFLLINHPLDCPICDQGGECDLQDQAMAYGVDTARFGENKRAVEDRNIGPLVKTIMTRCISCTRCVRFMTEVAGVEELGSINRGEDAEITTYLDKGMLSELSGNVIDLCPVGALTSRPYAFTARSWELRKTESIDVMDALGSNIRVDVRGAEVMRVLPCNHDLVNEEWISDKARFIWDGLRNQRLDKPYIRKDGKLRPASWEDAFKAIASKLAGMPGHRIGAIAGDLAGVEEMYALKELMLALGSPHFDCRQDSALHDVGLGRASYLFNSTIAGIDEADAILLVGSNPRLEAPVLNARIRKRWTEGALQIGLIGGQADLTYDYDYLGAGPQTLVDVLEGQHPFAEAFKGVERGMIIVGQSALARPDGMEVLALATRVATEFGFMASDSSWNGLNVLHTAAARVGGLDIGFVPGEGGHDVAGIINAAGAGELGVVYLLGADEFDMTGLGGSFVIYQGSHGDAGAHRADVILPGAAYTEKSATYVNTEGRVQMTERAAFPPGEAREDWAVIRALSAHLDNTLPFDSLDQLRAKLYSDVPHLAAIDQVDAEDSAHLVNFSKKGIKVQGDSFAPMIRDYYMTNPIARASAVMAEMSALKREQERGATGTHG